MSQKNKYYKAILFYITSLIVGAFLFIAMVSSDADSGILNPALHRQLFTKHDIYSQTQDVINNSMKYFISNFKSNYPKNYDTYKDVFSKLEQTFTSDMVKKNLDSLRDGIFEYVKGEKIFLPDIYLNNQAEQDKQQSISSQESSPASQALTKISRINLSVILSYIDRNDIADSINILKFFYFIMRSVPVFFFLLFLLSCIISYIVFKKFQAFIKWIRCSLAMCSILELVFSLALVIYSYLLLPRNASLIAMSIPLQNSTIVSYLRDCINYSLLFLVITSLALFMASFALAYMENLPSNMKRFKLFSGITSKNSTIVRLSIFAAAFVITVSLLGYESFLFKKGFESNDFETVITKMENSGSVTKIISARDGTIYSLEIKLVDHKTDSPVPDTKINITGKSSESKKDFNETATTDNTGTAKFILDKGTFRLIFNSTGFPVQYQMPSPFSFNLERAGTTTYTISLSNVQSIDKSRWGIVEIEVLDNNNKPVSNLQLADYGVISAPGYPDKIYSSTNSEGIAVFKINEGNHKISFVKDNFPSQYSVPSVMDVTATYNTVTRYTIRLATSKKSGR